MALEALKDNLREQIQNIQTRLEESPSFNTLREKYEALNPTHQNLLIIGFSLLLVLGIVSVPYGYYSSSQEYITMFDEKRELLRDLLRSSRIANSQDQATTSLGRTEIEGQIQQVLGRFSLLPEQVVGIETFDLAEFGPSQTPADILSEPLALRLTKLNLQQIQELAYQLQYLSSSVKLMGLSVQAGKPDPHYFNVIFKLISYSMRPVASEPVSAESNKSADAEPDTAKDEE